LVPMSDEADCEMCVRLADDVPGVDGV